MALALAVCNQKGGVGKTTTTFHLARAAARAHRRVLLVDADPQGNLTSLVAAEEPQPDQVGLADVLSDRTSETIRDVVVATVWEGIDLVPTVGTALGSVRDEITMANVGRERRLGTALQATNDQYDLILIDCAPSLDQLTINALSAAHGAIVVTHAKKLSLDGFAQLLQTIHSVKEHYNRGLQVSGIIVNQFEAGTISAKTWLEELQAAAQQQDLPILHPPVPKRVVIADAAEAARGLDEWGSAEAADLATIYDAYLNEIEGAHR